MENYLSILLAIVHRPGWLDLEEKKQNSVNCLRVRLQLSFQPDIGWRTRAAWSSKADIPKATMFVER